MKSGLKALLLIVIIFSACSLRAESFVDPRIFCEQKLEVFGLAGMPWENQISQDEERARAWMDALHHAYEQVLTLPLMEGRLVRHVLQTNPALKERLGEILLAAPRTFYQADNSGMIRCRIEIPLSGKKSLRSALYLAALRPQSQLPVGFNPDWASVTKVDDKAPSVPYKRIIVDLRSCVYEPSLFPRFFNDEGSLLFQEAMIPAPERFSRPAIKYMTDIRAAREGVADEETYVVSARISSLASCDITVEHGDVNLFSRFCNELSLNPLAERDLIVVYDPLKLRKTGKLVRAEKKQETADKAK
jgi:hypothetical protein